MTDQEIAAGERKIVAELREKIGAPTLHQFVICYFCGKIVPAESYACSRCGWKVSASDHV